MTEAATRKVTVDFHPRHPAAHRLRLVLELDGEAGRSTYRAAAAPKADRAKDLSAGNSGNFDRLNYVAPMMRSTRLAAEKLLGIEVPRRAQLIRVLYCEIGRLLSHQLNVTDAVDVRALAPAAVGARKDQWDSMSRASGSRRMHAAYFRVGGVHQDLPPKLIDDIAASCDPFLKVCDDLEVLLTENRIFKQRNVDGGPGRCLGARLLRRHGARLGRGVGLAPGAALRVLFRVRIRHPRCRTATTSVHSHGGDAPVDRPS